MESLKPVVRVDTLIRKPVVEVFQAFVDPTVITKFWLAKASGPLVAGTKVTWDFMVPGAQAVVEVKAIEANRRIEIDWGGGSMVEWMFTPRSLSETLVVVTNRGFSEKPTEAMTEALDSAQGFTLVMTELKAFLEQGIRVNAVKDKALLIEESMR